MTASPEAVALVEEYGGRWYTIGVDAILCEGQPAEADLHGVSKCKAALLAHIAAVEARATTYESAIRAALDHLKFNEPMRAMDVLAAALEKP